MDASKHWTNRVRHVTLAIACALALQLGWPAGAGAKPCTGAGSTTKCSLDTECCEGLVCNKRCQRGCRIGGVFYENGARNPLNDCQSCQSLVNRFGWTNLASGVTCGGAPSGQCDAQNTCNGSGACIDNVQASSASCTGSSNGGPCDAADHCSGTNKTCVDEFKASGTVCRSSAGQCDVAEACSGASGACPSDGFASPSTTCAGASNGGPCDATDRCSGTANTCIDGFASSGTVCRSAAGACDVAEVCSGTAGSCPGDAKAPSSTACRAAAGSCDVAEHCTGTSDACPGDGFVASGTVCRVVNGACDVAERCTGSGAACPDDQFKAPGVQCRTAAGACDEAEFCNGGSPDCPSDGVKATGTVCRDKAGFCDVAETCDGTSTACPDDTFLPATTLCRDAGAVEVGGGVVGFGDCDLPEYCTGTDAQCPPDAFKPSSVVCRPAGGPCDFEETCGLGKSCPIDVKRYGDECRAPDPSKLCDAGGVCDGLHDACPASNSPKASGTVCRLSGGLACDPTDVCDGKSLDCPPDAPAPAGTVCAQAALCREESVCSGDTGHVPGDYFCPTQQLSPQGTACGAAETECREAGFCTIVGRCATPPKANGTRCHLSQTEPGQCSYGTCVAITCHYNIECPDGSVCQNGTCATAADGTAGAACTGGAATGAAGSCDTGLNCCAGMRGDGQGGLAGAGQAGRCAECCGPFPGDGGCTNSFTECCDGECRFTNTDEEHCGGCAYAGGGGSACASGISACTPGTQCRDGVCLYSSACPNSPDQAYACELPSSGQISPACLQDCTTRYCDATGCNSLFYYSCIGACPDLTTPECLDKASNYQGCDLTCTPVVGCFGDGTVCSTNGDCCSGACRSPCKGNLFGTDCNEPPVCVKP